MRKIEKVKLEAVSCSYCHGTGWEYVEDQTVRRCRCQEATAHTSVVAASEAKSQFSKLIQRAAENGDQFIVEQKGRPLAVIIGIDDFKRLGHLEKDAAPEDAQEEKVQRLARRLGSRYQLPKKKQQQLFELMDKQEKGALSAIERKALHRLLKECDELMLKRARALDEVK